MAGGVSFFSFTTEVAPGAGTRVAADKLPDDIYVQHVKVAFGAMGSSTLVSTDTPLPVTLITGTPGTPFYSDASTGTVPGVAMTLIDFTVPSGTVRNIKSVRVVCRVDGNYTVERQGSIIGSGNTGPASPESQHVFDPGRAASGGDNVKVIFTPVTGTPNNRKLEAYLQAVDS